MKIVVTVMVRDEIDVMAAWVEHHLAQDVDLIIATDNASVDGTAEVLQRYADLGLLELHHDPVHHKQQHAVVTGMARRAYTEHHADWVINADADEFWAPQDKRLTLRKALEQVPLALNAFTAPVTNLIGPPALRGSGLERLRWRDMRSTEQLQEVGIHAQPTADAVHRGDPDVVVSQGNHYVSLKSAGQPDPSVALDVLHVPWRSWSQFEQKVINTGRAYESNPNLRPSPRHHGMADYRRHLAGRLWYAFLLRMPPERALRNGEADGTYAHDPWLSEHLCRLLDRAAAPDLLAACLDTTNDEPVDPDEHEAAARYGRMFASLEHELIEARARIADREATARRLANERDRAIAERDRARAKAPPARLAADWKRVARRTAGAVVRRLPRPGRVT